MPMPRGMPFGDGPDAPPPHEPDSIIPGTNPHDVDPPIAGHYPPAPNKPYGGPEPHVGAHQVPFRDHRPSGHKFGGAKCPCPQCRGR